MTILNKLNGWQRLWLLSAVIWAIPVVTFTVATVPIETVSEINTHWANAKIDLMRKYHGNGEPLAEFRQRQYGMASDEEIIYPTKKNSGHFDFTTAVPTDEAETIDMQSDLSGDSSLDT